MMHLYRFQTPYTKFTTFKWEVKCDKASRDIREK